MLGADGLPATIVLVVRDRGGGGVDSGLSAICVLMRLLQVLQYGQDADASQQRPALVIVAIEARVVAIEADSGDAVRCVDAARLTDERPVHGMFAD